MTVNEYIQYNIIGSGITEFDLGTIFGIDPKVYSNISDFKDAIEQRTKINEAYELPSDGRIKYNGKWWYWDTDISKTTTEQWCVMNETLASGVDISPRFIAIYFRPEGETFNAERVNDIADELLNMDVNIFLALNKVFFYLGMKLLVNLKIFLLNQQRKINQKEKRSNTNEYGEATDGI